MHNEADLGTPCLVLWRFSLHGKKKAWLANKSLLDLRLDHYALFSSMLERCKGTIIDEYVLPLSASLHVMYQFADPCLFLQALQAAVQRLHNYVSTLEEKVDELQKKK
jgi:hypothetical protein